MLSGRRKLLLADDSPTVRKVVEMFFGEEGYEVVTVGVGAEALRELNAEPPPDVLLADAVMPGPDGYELCERVKRDARLSNVPVVLLVGTFEPFNEAEARRVGADTVLTKPFQSIRDLVSKVGSLLGGEPKHEPEHSPHEESRDERAELSARPETVAVAEQGSHTEARGDESAHAFDPEAAHTFDADAAYADLGADDELIEVSPADAFVAGSASEGARGAGEYGQASHDAYAQTSDSQTSESDREHFVARDEHASEDFSGGRYGAREYEHAGANGHSTPAHAASPYVTPNYSEDNQMPAQPSFEARAASAAAADDTLLDLGQLEPHAGTLSSAAEADDFILDLDDEVLDSSSVYAEAPQPDAPSAFAEAAHGEQPVSFKEPAEPFSQSSVSFAEPSVSFSEEAAPLSESAEAFSEPAVPFAASAHSFSEDASASSSSEDEYSFDARGSHPSSFEHTTHDAQEAVDESASEFVLQDGPQGFAAYVAPHEVGTAPRGFVEPEVVPADVPAPSAVEGEFTDGSVEGDLPKAPAVAEAQHSEPSTAGYVVSDGHTRVEEPVRAADQLSPEAIDAIARRVVELMSDKVVREIAWEVVPELSDLLIKQRLEEGRK